MRRPRFLCALIVFVFLLLPSAASAQPGQATLVSTADGGVYTFTWNAVAGATYYYLWVSEGSTPKHQAWYTSAQTRCAAGELTCSIAVALPNMAFVQGNWWIQTWSSAGYGPWSAVKTFDIRPPKPPIVTDANNRYVGTLLSQNIVLIDVAGLPASAIILATGFQSSTLNLFYTTNNCTGTAYSYAVFPDRVEFTTGVNNAWLYRGTPVNITSLSMRNAESNGTFSGCTTENTGRTVMPVTLMNLTSQLGSFVTPFKTIR